MEVPTLQVTQRNRLADRIPDILYYLVLGIESGEASPTNILSDIEENYEEWDMSVIDYKLMIKIFVI